MNFKRLEEESAQRKKDKSDDYFNKLEKFLGRPVERNYEFLENYKPPEPPKKTSQEPQTKKKTTFEEAYASLFPTDEEIAKQAEETKKRMKEQDDYWSEYFRKNEDPEYILEQERKKKLKEEEYQRKIKERKAQLKAKRKAEQDKRYDLQEEFFKRKIPESERIYEYSTDSEEEREKARAKKQQTRDKDFEEIKATRKKGKEDDDKEKANNIKAEAFLLKQNKKRLIQNAKEFIKNKKEDDEEKNKTEAFLLKQNKKRLIENAKQFIKNKKEDDEEKAIKLENIRKGDEFSKKRILKEKEKILTGLYNKHLTNNPDKLEEMAKMYNTGIKGKHSGEKYEQKLKRKEEIAKDLTRVGYKIENGKAKAPEQQKGIPLGQIISGKPPPKPKGGAMKKTKKTKKPKETAQERKKRMEYIRSFKKK